MIKRKMTSAFAVVAMMGVATAFAVNPFSDVPSDSWAYQAVDQLATAGILSMDILMVLSKGKIILRVMKWLK